MLLLANTFQNYSSNLYYNSYFIIFTSLIYKSLLSNQTICFFNYSLSQLEVVAFLEVQCKLRSCGWWTQKFRATGLALGPPACDRGSWDMNTLLGLRQPVTPWGTSWVNQRPAKSENLEVTRSVTARNHCIPTHYWRQQMERVLPGCKTLLYNINYFNPLTPNHAFDWHTVENIGFRSDSFI